MARAPALGAGRFQFESELPYNNNRDAIQKSEVTLFGAVVIIGSTPIIPTNIFPYGATA